MFSLKVLSVLLLTNCVFAGVLFKNAGSDDFRTEGLKKFFTEITPGKPEVGVKPMDPMIVKNINFPEESLGINTYFSELKVTGLKEVVVNSYTHEGNDAVADLKYKLTAEGPVSVQFPKKNKDLKGSIKYEADIEGKLSFPISTADGKTIFGEPTITCEATNAKYTITNDYVQVLEKDPDASAVEADYDKLHDEHVKKVACEINKAVFTQIFENIKALVASEE